MFILWIFCYAAFWLIFLGTVAGRYLDEYMKINFLLMVTSRQVCALFHNNTNRDIFYFHNCRVSVRFVYPFFTSHDVIAGNPSVEWTRNVYTCIKESNAHKYGVMNLPIKSRTIIILLDTQNFSSKLSSQNHSLLWIFFALYAEHEKNCCLCCLILHLLHAKIIFMSLSIFGIYEQHTFIWAQTQQICAFFLQFYWEARRRVKQFKIFRFSNRIGCGSAIVT